MNDFISIIIIGVAAYTTLVWSIAYVLGHKKGLEDAMKVNKELRLIK